MSKTNTFSKNYWVNGIHLIGVLTILYFAYFAIKTAASIWFLDMTALPYIEYGLSWDYEAYPPYSAFFGFYTGLSPVLRDSV